MSGRRMSMVAAALVVTATLVAGATASSQATNAGGGYKVVGTWGKIGTGNGQFASSHNGIAVDKAGSVYIADTDNNRVQSSPRRVRSFASGARAEAGTASSRAPKTSLSLRTAPSGWRIGRTHGSRRSRVAARSRRRSRRHPSKRRASPWM